MFSDLPSVTHSQYSHFSFTQHWSFKCKKAVVHLQEAGVHLNFNFITNMFISQDFELLNEYATRGCLQFAMCRFFL